VRLINELSFNEVVQSEWRYACKSHLGNYIFVMGSCLAEINNKLAVVP
jgi:hypothetical protein